MRRRRETADGRGFLNDQLGRLGDTGYALDGLEADLEGALIVPVSELNRLRRDLCDRLTALRREPPRWTLLPYAPAATAVTATAAEPAAESQIVVVIREPEQLEPALAWGARVIYAEFEDPKKFRAAVARVRAYEQEAGRKVEFWAMGPRVHKQGEGRITEIVLSCEADGYLARNHDDLRAFAGSVAAGISRSMWPMAWPPSGSWSSTGSRAHRLVRPRR